MRTKELERRDGQRTLLVVFDINDEVSDGLLATAREHQIEGAYFSAIGALSEVTLGYWEWKSKEYLRIPVREQVEVLSLTGNIALGPDGTPKVHAHVVISKRDGSAHGGHLLDARVRPTLEVMLVEVPKRLQRRLDMASGLPLLDARA
jgi:predicted DNA-binding protein with PD1-like motif